MEELKRDSTPREALSPKSSIPNKLLEFQKRVSAISKDSVNPFFKSKYFDVNTVIDTIKPILNEVGLVVRQPLGVLEGKNILHTEVIDGERIIADSQVLVPEIADIQKFGAALTYLRRYALVSLLLLQGEEDDDGNSNAPQKPKSAISKANPPEDEYQGAPKAIRPISQKQALFIKSLRSQKHLPQVSDEDLRKLTSQEATDEIERLKNLQDEVPTITIEQGDYPA